jgi:hypothetical protein
MTVIRVKGFKIFPDRHGHLRCYHRKTGIRVDLKKAPLGSAEFLAACAKIAALAEVNAAEMFTGLGPKDALDLPRNFSNGNGL